ncbi:hypothetical protein J8281_05970 [Aquimarina sp. U1-2]|uniref:hypothetical protein n=1 Tax=Aquimarina sp. U1-2 TaxID=2823141 RepID=UPI001AECE8E7|nr:hypothetical protein [Aquimarina sp. U1-2]MBP2831731.1 hypothetical protein [Aquimarina sp. U1-2]
MIDKRYWYVSVIIFICVSCDGFVFTKEHQEEIIKEGLDKLNWNQVEQPPLFESCKTASEEKLEQCFQQTITTHFYTFLSKQKLQIDTAVHDTIWIPLLITKKSKVVIEDFELPDTIASQIPNLKDILDKGLQSLPAVAPAHTRGTPVTARYQLPLVIRID